MSTADVPLLQIKPPSNLGMVHLDRSKFQLKVPLVLAQVENVKMLTRIVKESPKSDILNVPRLPKIISISPTQRGILLAQHITQVGDALNHLSEKTVELLKESGFKLVPWHINLDYEFWTSDEILHSILPPSLGDLPSGFAVVGHIAHINLRDQFLPFKHVIGQVILDKNQPSVRTVVNKLDTIDSVYRTFDMEILAGENNFNVEQQESGCRFKFDFRKVYWNSRLHTEHGRLVQLFGKGQAICDPMAGVGPFAIPAAKQGNIVFANDLNPEGFKAMQSNIVLNKINPEIIPVFNEDARIFIRNSIKRLHAFRSKYEGVKLNVMAATKKANCNNQKVDEIPKNTKKPKTEKEPKTVEVPETFSHFVMNLPATAIEFLDGFRGLYTGQKFSTSEPPLPMIHVHCFFKFDPQTAEPSESEVAKSIAEDISRFIGFKISSSEISLHNVRRVAPAKDMYAVTFRLPKEVAYATDVQIENK